MLGKTFCDGRCVDITAYTSKVVKAQQSVSLLCNGNNSQHATTALFPQNCGLFWQAKMQQVSL